MQTRHIQPALATRSTVRPGARDLEERVEKQVQFVLQQPEARSVTVAGSFNNWNPKQTPLHKDPVTGWKTTLSLPLGRYEYRFVVDGQWMSDPRATESAKNAFGTTNSVLFV
jgi:1,4-alpha-glucan branching enzyme